MKISSDATKGRRPRNIISAPLRNAALICATVVTCSLLFGLAAQACTGIRLIAADGSVVCARTLEFGIDLRSDVIMVPRGYARTGSTPEGANGLKWTSKYASLGANGVGLPFLFEGVNEKGLAAGVFYFPTTAGYMKYDPAKAAQTMAPWEIGSWILENFATIEEVKQNIGSIVVAPVVFEKWGFVPPVHFVVYDTSGKSIVIEYIEGKLHVDDDVLGVITNSPSFDWHMTNLRNYVNFSMVNVPPVEVGGVKLEGFGQGTGMLGMPGDFTPPSRFVRAVAFSKTARPTPTGDETIYEVFRILDNFNVPLGASEGSGEDKTQGMRSSTIWTSASDTHDKVFYYHTQHNRRVRMVDLKKIDFASFSDIKRLPLDKVKAQDIEDVTP
jgi:choloylglycine hydrolase